MITKDTLATVTPAAEAVEVPATQTSATTKNNDSAALRADAVSLEVPVRVHGSHVLEATKDNPARTEPFEETTATMIIFPQGAVLRMATPVSVAQMIVVTNLKSGQDAICRIVKVRAYGPNQSYVEAEFTHRQVGYWGVQFASDPAQTAPKAPLPKLDSREKSVAEATRPRSAQDVSILNLRGSSPVGSGSPKVEDSAAGASSGTGREARPIAAALNPAVTPVDLSGGDAFPDVVETSSEPPAEGRVESSRGESGYGAALGRFSSSGSLTSGALTGRGSREISSARGEEESAAEPNSVTGNKILMIGGAAAAVVLAAGAYFFFHAHATQPVQVVTAPQAAVISENSSPTPVVPSIAAPASPASALSSGASSPAKKASAPNPVPAASSNAVTAAPRAESADREAAAIHAADSAAPAASPESPAPHHSAEVPSLFGVLNAHPAAPHSNSQLTEAAPEIDPNALNGTPGSALPGIALQRSLTAPKFTSIPPRLISSVSPQYPTFAQRMNVQGSVVISAVIETNGTVGQMKVVSGPELLRQAALDALRRWKYEPGRVDGQPTPTQTNVTIEFLTKTN